jgi:hypothetical protein
MNRLIILGLLLLALCNGCKAREKDKSVFHQEAGDYVLLIALSDDIAKNERSYRFILEAIDRYFLNRIGTKDSVMLARIEGSRPLIWKGPPRSLRHEFPDPDSLRKSLLTSQREEGSLHDGLVRSLKLLTRDYGVVQGKTRAVTMVLSDMNDKKPSEESDRRFIETLIDYVKAKGEIAFYFVDQLRIQQIEEKTKEAGLKWCDIQPQEGRDIPLPEFN